MNGCFKTHNHICNVAQTRSNKRITKEIVKLQFCFLLAVVRPPGAWLKFEAFFADFYFLLFLCCCCCLVCSSWTHIEHVGCWIIDDFYFIFYLQTVYTITHSCSIVRLFICCSQSIRNISIEINWLYWIERALSTGQCALCSTTFETRLFCYCCYRRACVYDFFSWIKLQADAGWCGSE